MNNLYNEFLENLNVPTEEQFNSIVEKLPNFSHLSEDFEYDPNWDELAEQLFKGGVFADYNCDIETINLDKKEVIMDYCENIEELEKVNNLLTSNDWKFVNYQKIKKILEEEEEEENYSLREKLIDKISNYSTEELEELIKFKENGFKK